MVVVGGMTRLTHSGLSITEWQPIVGALPPLNEADWNDAFTRYQATPEYRQVNAGMTLAEFKPIFWWEYFHRLLGRVIGIAFLAPLAWFALRGRIERSLVPRLLGIFALGGLQGALGWAMVQSGLVDDPRVSQLRLAAHLGLALLIFAAMFWLALSLLRDPPRASQPAARSLRVGACLVAALVFLQALSGGLVAGIRAGFAYNTFPDMNGRWLPDELWLLQPWYRNLSHNMATVQFDHRLLALTLVFAVVFLAWRGWRSGGAALKRALAILLLALVVQAGLGIATLLLVVPLPLAALHQAGAVLLFAAALHVAHTLRPGREFAFRGRRDHDRLPGSAAAVIEHNKTRLGKKT